MTTLFKYLLSGLLLTPAFGCSYEDSIDQRLLLTDGYETTDEVSRHKFVVAADSSVVWLDMSGGHAKATISKKAGQAVHIKFHGQEQKQVKADITCEDTEANIRIYEIVKPDGDATGPFGHSTLYDLDNDGVYKMTVRENIMAGDPWKGLFTIELSWLDI